MKFTEEKSKGLTREFKAVIPAADFEKEVDSKIESISKNTKIAGFRPGKAPKAMLKQKYRTSVLGEVLDEMLKNGADEIIKENKLRPAVMPEINLTAFGDNKDIEFTVVDPEGDDFSLRLDDNGNMAKISVNAIDATAVVEVVENTATVKNAPAGVKVVAGITPEFGTQGNYALTLTATDTCGNEAYESARYLVEHVNRAPKVVATDDYMIMMATTTSDIISFANFFEDPDGDELYYDFSVSLDDIVTAYTSKEGVILVANKVGVAIVRITATDPSGASAVYAFELEVTEFDGIENITINSQVNVFPNPVVTALNVTCDFNCDTVNYCIYGANGAVVYNEIASCISGQAHTINVDQLPAGLYLLKVTTDQGVATYPVIKK